MKQNEPLSRVVFSSTTVSFQQLAVTSRRRSRSSPRHDDERRLLAAAVDKIHAAEADQDRTRVCAVVLVVLRQDP